MGKNTELSSNSKKFNINNGMNKKRNNGMIVEKLHQSFGATFYPDIMDGVAWAFVTSSSVYFIFVCNGMSNP